MWSFCAKCGVVAMTRMHHGVIVKAAEDLAFKIIHQRREVRGAGGLARPAGEQAVPGEQMHPAGAAAYASVIEPGVWPTRPMTSSDSDPEIDAIAIPDSDQALRPRRRC